MTPSFFYRELPQSVIASWVLTGCHPVRSPSQRANNWSSHGHRSLKTRSIVCYIVEWTLYLIYWVVALKASLLGLVFGFVALVLPQWALTFALQTQEIMRKILQSLDEDEASIPSTVNL